MKSSHGCNVDQHYSRSASLFWFWTMDHKLFNTRQHWQSAVFEPSDFFTGIRIGKNHVKCLLGWPSMECFSMGHCWERAINSCTTTA